MAAQPEPNAQYLVMRRANSMRRTAKPPANVENRRLWLIAPNDALLCQAGDHRRGCRDRQHGAILRWSRQASIRPAQPCLMQRPRVWLASGLNLRVMSAWA